MGGEVSRGDHPLVLRNSEAGEVELLIGYAHASEESGAQTDGLLPAGLEKGSLLQELGSDNAFSLGEQRIELGLELQVVRTFRGTSHEESIDDRIPSIPMCQDKGH